MKAGLSRWPPPPPLASLLASSIARLSGWDHTVPLDEWKQPRILQRCFPVADAIQIFLVRGEFQEVIDAVLTYEHSGVPPLLRRPNQITTAHPQ